MAKLIQFFFLFTGGASGDGTAGGATDVILMANNTDGILLAGGASGYIKKAA